MSSSVVVDKNKGKLEKNKENTGFVFPWGAAATCVVFAFLIAAVFPHIYSERGPQLATDQVVGETQTPRDLSSVVPEKAEETCSCTSPALSGVVDDCCCEYSTVDQLNTGILFPLLQELVTQPFFKFFKVRLWCQCPFWPDDGVCHLRDCSVCECSEEEVPAPFRRPGAELKSAEDPACQEGNPQATVDRHLDRHVAAWQEGDNPWTADNEAEEGADMVYVDLRRNPERYTGYKGVSARRVWESVYQESCFKDGLRDACTERRVFFRLISGLHTSITIHIAAHYLVDEVKGVWGPNVWLYQERVGKFPERLQNLYFALLFVLRAVTKAGDFLASAEYSTGSPAEDAHTLELVQLLVHNPQLQSACPVPFDEGKLWQGEEGPELRKQLQANFRNISHIMDCVGCEKCRLWGKLQILGLGTALKILFSVDEHGQVPKLELQRNEVIALVNLLARLSESLQSAADLSRMASMSQSSVAPLPASVSQGQEHSPGDGLLNSILPS